MLFRGVLILLEISELASLRNSGRENNRKERQGEASKKRQGKAEQVLRMDKCRL